jgi:hypothetical protein
MILIGGLIILMILFGFWKGLLYGILICLGYILLVGGLMYAMYWLLTH